MNLIFLLHPQACTSNDRGGINFCPAHAVHLRTDYRFSGTSLLGTSEDISAPASFSVPSYRNALSILLRIFYWLEFPSVYLMSYLNRLKKSTSVAVWGSLGQLFSNYRIELHFTRPFISRSIYLRRNFQRNRNFCWLKKA